jgi:hypothetical protein
LGKQFSDPGVFTHKSETKEEGEEERVVIAAVKTRPLDMLFCNRTIASLLVSLLILCVQGNGHDNGSAGSAKDPSVTLHTWGITKPSHYSSIGYPFNIEKGDSEGGLNWIQQIAMDPRTKRVNGTPQNSEYLYYCQRSSCGAQLWCCISPEGGGGGFEPHFTGPSRIRLKVEKNIDDGFNAGYMHGQARDVGDHFPPEDEEIYLDENRQLHMNLGLKIQVNCPTYHIHGKDVPIGCIVTAQVAAFSHTIHIYDNLEEFKKQQQSEEGISFSDKSFFQMRFDKKSEEDDCPPPAVLSGHVLQVERKVNENTGEAYYWALVETLNDCKLDVVIHPAWVNSPLRPGCIILGEFYLSARLLPPEN